MPLLSGLFFFLADAAIRQANWDASKIREKLKRDIDAHASSVQSEKLSKLVANYEVLIITLHSITKLLLYVRLRIRPQ